MNRKRILFRIKASRKHGMGHAYRCLTLAEELKGQGADCVFAMPWDAQAANWIERQGYSVIEPKAAAEKPNAHLVVFDLQDADPQELCFWKAQNAKILSFDDLGEAQHLADCLVDANRPVEHGRCFGPDYIVLKKAFRQENVTPRKIAPKARKILLCLGGSDPQNNGWQLLKACENLAGLSWTWVCGPLQTRFAAMPGVRVLRSVKDMAPLMAAQDVILVSGGVSLYEAAAVGVPTVALALNEHQRHNIERYAAQQAFVNLGLASKLPKSRLRFVLRHMQNHYFERLQYSRRLKALVDGQGLERVLKEIQCLIG